MTISYDRGRVEDRLPHLYPNSPAPGYLNFPTFARFRVCSPLLRSLYLSLLTASSEVFFCSKIGCINKNFESVPSQNCTKGNPWCRRGGTGAAELLPFAGVWNSFVRSICWGSTQTLQRISDPSTCTGLTAIAPGVGVFSSLR